MFSVLSVQHLVFDEKRDGENFYALFIVMYYICCNVFLMYSYIILLENSMIKMIINVLLISY